MYFSINDADYWYETAGNGPAVVLLHGFTGSTATWNDLAEQLQSEYQVIRIDLPGHGKSKMKNGRTMQECCFDLACFVQYLDLTKVHLLGYSMGGRTALSFAIYYPELVHSLILESTSAGIEDAVKRQERVNHDQQLALQIQTKGIKEFVSFWEDIPLFQTQKKLKAGVRDKMRKERLSQSEQGLSQSLCYMGTGAQPSWWKHLGGVRVPVLLIAGELDSKFIAINKKLLKDIDSCDLAIIKNAGHTVHVERPVCFGELVLKFLRENKV